MPINSIYVIKCYYSYETCYMYLVLSCYITIGNESKLNDNVSQVF